MYESFTNAINFTLFLWSSNATGFELSELHLYFFIIGKGKLNRTFLGLYAYVQERYVGVTKIVPVVGCRTSFPGVGHHFGRGGGP
jgi:hypothetical protein